MTELSLNIKRTLQAPLQTVFNAWLDPTLLGKFMIPGEGVSTGKVTSDAKEGGRFSIIMVGKAGDLPHGGEYQLINKYSQIIFTWESPFSVEGSKVTLNFTGDETQTQLEFFVSLSTAPLHRNGCGVLFQDSRHFFSH